MKKYRSLRNKIITSFSSFIVITLFILIIVQGNWIKNRQHTILDENSRSILEATRIHIANLDRSMEYFKASLIEKNKQEVRGNGLIGKAILNNYYELFQSGILDEAESKELALNCLRKTRFEIPGGFFWAFDTSTPSARLIMHPLLPEIEGAFLKELIDQGMISITENAYSRIKNLIDLRQDGFVEYILPNPDEDNYPEYTHKLNYLYFFEPWDMYIATGSYLDMINKNIQSQWDSTIKNLNQLILQQKIGSSGYLFIFDDSYKLLVHPSLAGTDGRILLNPETKRPLLDEIIESVKNGETSIEYYWDKPGHEGDFSFQKKAYTIYYENLGWYICSTVYQTDINSEIISLMKNISIIITILIILAIILSFLVSHSIIRELLVLMKTLSITDASGLPKKILPDSPHKEIHQLSQIINAMIGSIKLSRKELEDQRDFSHRIVTEAPYIICSINHKGFTNYLNKRGEIILEYPQEEILDKSWTEVFSPREGNHNLGSIFEDIEQKEMFEREINVVTKTGKIRSILFSSMTRRNNRGDITEVILFGKDISEMRRAEQALESSEKRATLLLKIIPDLLFILNREGVFMDYESMGRQLYTNISFIGKHIGEVLPEHIAKLTMEKIDETLVTGNQVEYGYTLGSPETGPGFFEARMIPWREDQVFAIIRDMTEKKKMEEMMVQSEKMLSVGGLAAGMAHEINNPLAGMLQTAHVIISRLQDISLAGNIRSAEKLGTSMKIISSYMEDRGIFKMLDNISVSGMRIADIVGNMLSFARKGNDATSSHQITALLDKTLELAGTDFDLKKNYDFKKIKIIREYEKDVPLIPCQYTKLQQVFLNIIGNSAQAIQSANTENPVIIIRVFQDKERPNLIIEIDDNGPGMPENVRKRIFEPFFTTKPVGTGTGLGLSVSYFIIKENHNGEMSVKSQPGGGAAFRIILPIEQKNQ